ncbi:MoxR family ATPase [Clostridium sp. AF15-6B]|uniref:MoxR family ATPase n=2 Tax=Lachnospiraceae TaxID=186803 RepID=A0A7G9FR43_9FIRM|nr:MoxR family ATPase [Lachnospiraceae bacterium]QNM01025.1 MoxR family ATPase [Wujia chipingensis]RGH01341.1 MoxR family ATPase [Clostridium sp. AF16-25]RGH02964.1 MoxR family ATPase [Clostridium sp. AF15-49]RGH11997.1 MoxR family ATPase [Clostridium sp. AF15-6B]RHS84986.1 MoxR family ATPase [Clostridium sp. AM42-36]
MSQKLEQVQAEVNKVIKGKEDVVKKVLAAVIAGGHILMEDIPGVGKTTLATTFAKSMSMHYKRVQFTPDVLPSDILGFSMYNSATKEFEYREGAVFTNLFLADEINRTSPKTQSALLEVMEEKTATVDGVTRPLPDPFVVIATENPYGSSGTQMLPESQLDRFMVCLSMGYPSHADAVAILKGNAGKPLSKVQEVISMEEVLALRAMTNDLYVKDEIYEYIVNLVEATRTMEIFSMGASPRGTIALLRMAKAMAVIDGRDYVCAKDVQDVARDVLGHRVKLSARGKAQGITMQQAIGMVIANVTAPRV